MFDFSGDRYSLKRQLFEKQIKTNASYCTNSQQRKIPLKNNQSITTNATLLSEPPPTAGPAPSQD
jgi:hypothetical protein